jgi:hypothetical protein
MHSSTPTAECGTRAGASVTERITTSEDYLPGVTANEDYCGALGLDGEVLRAAH